MASADEADDLYTRAANGLSEEEFDAVALYHHKMGRAVQCEEHAQSLFAEAGSRFAAGYDKDAELVRLIAKGFKSEALRLRDELATEYKSQRNKK